MGQKGGNLGKASEEMAFKQRLKDNGPVVQGPTEELPRQRGHCVHTS